MEVITSPSSSDQAQTILTNLALNLSTEDIPIPDENGLGATAPIALLISNSVVLGIILVIMFLIMVLLIRRRNYQPLKKKSPHLIILSALGNFLFCLFILYQEIVYNGCVVTPTSALCKSQAFAKTSCLFGFLLLSICEPLALLPYIFRSIRLYVIFKAQDYYFKEKRKPTEWFKWIKEPRLIKLTLISAGILSVITLSLFIAYCFQPDVFIYSPAYTVQACYLKDLGDPAYNQNAVNDINLHTNISITCLIIIHAFECVLFILCLHYLRGIKDEFNIKSELMIVFITWSICSQISIILFMNQTKLNDWEWVSFILVIRSISVVLITSVKPIYQTYLENQYILLPPVAESIETLDMVLHIPIASEYFYEYLDKESNDLEATLYFSLYADLRIYDKACQDDDQEEKYEKAREIMVDYIESTGKFNIEIDKDIKRAIDSKFQSIQENLNEYLFIELYAFVLDKLREHFENFKRSTAFVELEDEISRQEKLYEVLVDASIISN